MCVSYNQLDDSGSISFSLINCRTVYKVALEYLYSRLLKTRIVHTDSFYLTLLSALSMSKGIVEFIIQRTTLE